MAIERRVVVNKTFEGSTKNINIQTITTLIVDGEEMAPKIHREVLCKGYDLSDEGRASMGLPPLDEETKLIAAAVWPEEVKE